ncbi:MAG: GNAT family N-acetyltransferase [Geminicoccaceae bacterium]
MRIRDFVADDAAALALIFHESVRRVGSRDYGREQVEAWSPAPVSAETFLARVSDGRLVLVAVDERDRPVGFIELETDGHIDCFYCHPDCVGTGVGSALHARLEQGARKAGLPRLHVEASEAARRFFLRKGYDLIGRRDFVRNNVPIHNYRMEKFLR